MPVPASRLARFELRRFRGPLPKVALVFVLLIPLLYGAIYLTANWDPYGRLDQLPVAVVNQDQPTTVDPGSEGDDETISAGADFVANLHEKADFDWRDVSADEAARGLKEGDYYLTVTVPEDFSANLISGQTDDPQRAKIIVRRNDANGFVIGSITNSAQASIERAVDQSAVESYFNAVFANLATIRQGMLDAADGSAKLSDGLTSAQDGSADLTQGAKDAAAGGKTLADGADDLADGLGTAKTGSADLASGLTQLKQGLADLTAGADQVAAGTQQLNDQVLPPLRAVQQVLPKVQTETEAISTALTTITNKASGRSQSIADDLDTADQNLAVLRAKYPELANDPAFTSLSGRVAAASTRADDIADATQTGAQSVSTINDRIQQQGNLTKLTAAEDNLVSLNNGAHQVADGAATLQTGIDSASTGANQLSSGISDASTGADKLSSGSDTLATGLTTLHSGASSLHSGIGELLDGSNTLHDELAKGAKRIPALTTDETNQAVQVLSSPADVQMKVDNPATFYGRGLAPMFFAIALWVFGISVFLVVRPITGRALAGRASPLRLALTGWLPIGTIAVLAGWLMIGTVWAFLGLDPVHPVMIMGVITLGAICFSAIAHLLRTALGTPGSSILLVWLIFQLTSAGGTYPSAVLPQFFQTIAPFMPMTYLIDAFRITISGGEMSHLIRDVIILALIAIAALGLCVWQVSKRQQFRIKDLHPPLVSP